MIIGRANCFSCYSLCGDCLLNFICLLEKKHLDLNFFYNNNILMIVIMKITIPLRK